MLALNIIAAGACIGFAICAVLWFLDSGSFRSYLVRKAQPEYRTPVCINGAFFYIVPEREFIAIEMRAMRAPTER